MENKIIKIHGCSGAGKTTLVRQFLIDPNKHMDRTGKKVEANQVWIPDVYIPTYILGSYENNCGGMDTVSSSKRAMELVAQFHSMGHVIHEGLLQSTYYGAMGTDSQKYGDNYIYAFLDTPIELCLERVIARRDEQGTTKSLNQQLTRDKHRTILRLRNRLEAEGIHKVIDLKHDEDLYSQIVGLLNARR